MLRAMAGPPCFLCYLGFPPDRDFFDGYYGGINEILETMPEYSSRWNKARAGPNFPISVGSGGRYTVGELVQFIGLEEKYVLARPQVPGNPPARLDWDASLCLGKWFAGGCLGSFVS